jgi:hypothetical protein
MEIPTHDTARDACVFALKRVRVQTVARAFGQWFDRPGFPAHLIAMVTVFQDVRTVSPISHSTGYGFHLAAFPPSVHPTPGQVRALLMRDDVRPSLDDWGTCAAALFSILSGTATIADAMARIRYALDDDEEPDDLVGIQSHGFATIEEIEISVLEVVNEFQIIRRAYATRTKAAGRVVRLGSLPGNPRGGLCSMGKRIFPEAMAWQEWDTIGRLIDGRPRHRAAKLAGVHLIPAVKTAEECPICYDVEKVSRRLVCGHVFGCECLHKLAETTGAICCPLCRATEPIVVRCIHCNDAGLVFFAGCCGSVVCARCCATSSRSCAVCSHR